MIKGISIHPFTYLASPRIHPLLSLFPAEFYAEGILQRGHNVTAGHLALINNWFGSQFTIRELLAYVVTAYHMPIVIRMQEHRYYRNILKDLIFIQYKNGLYVRGAGEYSLNVVDFYYFKNPTRGHSDLIIDLFTNYPVINNLVPGFNAWVSETANESHTWGSWNLLSYWYSPIQENNYVLIKPEVRKDKVHSWEPEYRWILPEDKELYGI